jgi:hypothetical protein
MATKDLARTSLTGAVSLTEIRLDEKFRCNWQIKQSVHPTLLVVAVDVCSDEDIEDVDPGVVKSLP